MAALPPYNACEASDLCTRSVAHLYTLCCTGAGRRPMFCSTFLKVGKMFPIGNVQAARPLGKPRSGQGLLRKQQGFNWFQRYRHRGERIRGLQNLEFSLQRETGCYFLRRAKSNTKSTRGKPCDPGSNRRSSHYF